MKRSFWKLGIISFALCGALPAAEVYLSLRCAIPSDHGYTLGDEVFLTAQEADVSVTIDGVKLKGREPKLAHLMRPDLAQCRSSYITLVDVEPDINGEVTRIYGSKPRDWNVLAVQPGNATRQYVCGVGTQVNQFDDKKAWLDALYQQNYSANDKDSFNNDVTVSDRACLVDQI